MTAHPGLELQRYFPGTNTTKRARSALLRHLGGNVATEDEAEVKRDLVSRIVRKNQCHPDFYHLVANRLSHELENLPRSITFNLKTSSGSRLIVGLGTASPIETGITLHHTYGVPIIPGSALKGITAHYCQSVYAGDADFQPGGIVYNTIFGTTESAGYVVFHDAFPPADGAKLVEEVMTPHNTNYYMGSGIPDGTESPIPVSYIAADGIFQFTLEITAEGDDWMEWAMLAARLLGEALRDQGVGAKGCQGYGRFDFDPQVLNRIIEERKIAEKEEVLRQELHGGPAWKVVLHEKELLEKFDLNPDDHVQDLDEILEGSTDEEKREIARYIQTWYEVTPAHGGKKFKEVLKTKEKKVKKGGAPSPSLLFIRKIKELVSSEK